MKIAITSQGKGIDAAVDERFGRCNFFVIINPNNMEHETLSNEAIASSGGAGIKAAQVLINKNVEALITGNIGPNAFNVLSGTGIKIITSVSGNVKEAVEKYLKGELKETDQPRPGFGMGRDK